MENEKRNFYFQFSGNYINTKSNKIYSLVLEKEDLKGWVDLEYSYNNECIDNKEIHYFGMHYQASSNNSILKPIKIVDVLTEEEYLVLSYKFIYYVDKQTSGWCIYTAIKVDCD